MGNPLGARFSDGQEELSAVLSVRNTSLMVHGWQPIKDDTFDKMLYYR
jgi:hypothetical protein